MNIYIVYKISLWSYTVGQDLTLEKVLSGATKLTANSDPDKYKYSSYGNGFDMNRKFSLPDGSVFAKNIITFGADMGSFVHIDNRKKIYWFLVKVHHNK